MIYYSQFSVVDNRSNFAIIASTHMRHVLLLLLLLSSCALPELYPDEPPKAAKPAPAPAPAPAPVIDANYGFIYGRVTVNGKKPSLISLEPQDEKPEAAGRGASYQVKVLEDGSYFAENVPPGKYFVNFEVSGVQIPVPQKSDFQKSGVSETKEIEIKPSEIYPMGALRMSLMERDENLPDQSPIQSFELDFDDDPSDIELLRKILKEPTIDRGGWGKKIRNEIERLNSEAAGAEQSAK